MPKRTIYKKVLIQPGCLDDYKKLAAFHYRDKYIGPFSNIYTLNTNPAAGLRKQTVGVIVYALPVARLQLRNIATDNFFIGFDRNTQLALLNKYVRRISRVIIEPRFRGLSLAAHLVRETLLMMNFPIIESLAVMGSVNPFFEKAGMRAFAGPPSPRNVRLIEAFGAIGIEDKLLIDAEAVQRKIEKLDAAGTEFIERETESFLQCFGNHRYAQPGIERTRYILSKLTARAVYFIWFKDRN
ncbi:hypothetical protein ACFLZ8_01530 [Planctomycetota bacterium]